MPWKYFNFWAFRRILVGLRRDLGGMVLGFEGGGRFFNTERLRNARGFLFGVAGFTSCGKRRRIEPISILAFSRSLF